MDTVRDTRIAFGEFYQGLMELNMDMLRNSMKLATSSWKVESYQTFYQEWMGSMKGFADRIMRMPGFAGHGWGLFKSTTGYRDIIRDAMELQLRQLDIPSHADVDELSERISYLDDQLEKLQQQVQLLQGKADTRAQARKK